MLHKEHETTGIHITTFPVVSFFLERTKQNSVVQSQKPMENLNQQSTFKKLCESTDLFIKDRKKARIRSMILRCVVELNS